MPKIVAAAAQRRQIRLAARRVFARRGVARTGLAQVAERAGMGRSTLYHYYPDKAALVRDLARDLLQEEAELFNAACRAKAVRSSAASDSCTGSRGFSGPGPLWGDWSTTCKRSMQVAFAPSFGAPGATSPA
ncbi:MAG: TetR/AcrR family transcriptional regulator [Deltaproteobacteria bacterium]|nr:MAG: TetR/AcrR family transcriptional regulator [Deltaproteobacteria bacterium]